MIARRAAQIVVPLALGARHAASRSSLPIEVLIRVGVINRFIVPLPSQIAGAFERIIVEEDVPQRFLRHCARGVWATRAARRRSASARHAALSRRLLRLATETWVAALAAAPIVLMYPLFLVIFGRSATTIIMMGFVAGPARRHPEDRRRTRRHAPRAAQRRAQLQAHARQQFWKILLPAALPTIFVGLRLGLIFALINIVGVEFLINFGGLGQLINDLAERYDLPGTYAAICFVVLVSVVLLHRHRKGRAMAETGRLTAPAAPPVAEPGDAACASRSSRPCCVTWEAVAASGLLYRDVVPSLLAIGRALVDAARRPSFYWHLGVTPARSAAASLIGGLAGLAVGIVLGANRFLSARLRALPLLSRPDAQDHLLPDHDHVVRRRPRLEGRDGRDLVLLPGRAQRRGRHAADRQGADPRRPQLPRQRRGRW